MFFQPTKEGLGPEWDPVLWGWVTGVFARFPPPLSAFFPRMHRRDLKQPLGLGALLSAAARTPRGTSSPAVLTGFGPRL
ncbi:MAG: hypothetical protein CM15mP128_3040 [Methanobacteriota archaeon]|nr:MAG: hypothetical protein CM15mP128_3040 [Euryarchaeota archaeon]